MAGHAQDILIGIDLGGTNIKGGVVTTEGEVVASDSVPSGVEVGVSEVLDRMAKLAENLVQKAGVDRGRVAALGIGSPGPLSAREGVVFRKFVSNKLHKEGELNSMERQFESV